MESDQCDARDSRSTGADSQRTLHPHQTCRRRSVNSLNKQNVRRPIRFRNMRSVLASVFVAALLLAWPMEAAYAQDLAPRAYIIAPTHSNAVTLTSSYQNGEIFLNGVEPVPDSHGQIYTSAFT